MTVQAQIREYIAGQPEPKCADMHALHRRVRRAFPDAKLWFHDGTDAKGKVVSNPNVGYGSYTISYADGSTRESFRIGLSGNTAGISIYILGLKDKTYLAKTYGKKIGKAGITGYCIKFKALKDIDVDVLEAAIRDGIEREE